MGLKSAVFHIWKYTKFVNLSVRKSHFMKYKEFWGGAHFLKYRKIRNFLILELESSVSRLIRNSFWGGLFYFSYLGLKSDSHLPKNNYAIWLIESPLKMMKNAFYFIWKAFSILKIFRLLTLLFGRIGKTSQLER